MVLPVDMGAKWTASRTEVGRHWRMMGGPPSMFESGLNGVVVQKGDLVC